MPRLGSRIIVVATALAAMLTLMSISCGGSEEPTPVPATATSVPATATVAAAATAVPPTPTPAPAEPIQIVATSNIVGEWIRIVGGDHVEVTDLVPRGVDPHSYQPGARDIARVADAEIVFAVGLALEQSWLEDLVENAAADHDVIIELGNRIDPIEFSFETEDHHEDEEAEGDDHADEEMEGDDHADEADEDEGEDHHGEGDEDEDAEAEEGEDHHDEDNGDAEDEEGEDHHDEDEKAEEDEDHHGEENGDAEEEDEHHDEDDVEEHHQHDEHDHGLLDPHFWLDPNRVIVAVRQIAKELREMDPDQTDYYNANRDAYLSELTELDHWIDEKVSAIAASDRVLVTTHDSLGYFANRYGFEVAGVIIPGGGTDVERSPQEFAELVETVQEEGASVVFAEAQLSDRLANTLAQEAGIRFVSGLTVGSLSADDGTAPTYVDMMRLNVNLIADSLTQ